MNDGLAVLVALLLLSAMLSVILTIAWATLGRARHARTWAIAFAVGTVQWAANIAYYLSGGGPILFMLVNGLAVIVAGLLAIGFRERNGLPELRTAFRIAGLATIAVIAWATFIQPNFAVGKAAPLVFRALALAVAAISVVPHGRRGRAAELAAVVMLWAFVLFNIAVAVVAVASGKAAYFDGLDRWMLLLGLPTAFAGTGLFAVFLLAADLAERMRLLAARDPLTGVLNRRGFEEEAGRAIANTLRYRRPMSLALADLDCFKAVNDIHGHAAGDAILRRFANDVGDAIRHGDLIGRLGGEEFVLLLVNTPGEAAMAVIDRLRREVATLTLDTDASHVVTTSFGVTEVMPGDISIDMLIARADRALYKSKMAGRNRVTFAGPTMGAGPA